MSMTESTGAQDWRAVACLAPGGERLLCVGESSSQVRAAYAGAWGEVIRDEDRPTVRAISLQRWSGQAWAGQWEHQTYLAVPATRGKAGAGDPVGQGVDAGALGGVMSGDDQSDPERFCFQGAMEPRLAGQQGVGRGAGGVAQEVVAGAADDRHAGDLPPDRPGDLDPARR